MRCWLILPLLVMVQACSLPLLAQRPQAVVPTGAARATEGWEPGSSLEPESVTPAKGPAASQTPEANYSAEELQTSVESLPDPEGYRWVLMVNGLEKPLALKHAGDEPLFFVEQRGVIRVFLKGTLQTDPFLDIRDRVNSRASE